MPKGIHSERGSPARCHPPKKNYGKGLCQSCWQKEDYKRKPEVFKARRLQKYGMSMEQYAELLKQQEGKCAICFSDKPRQGKSLFFHVDHNHKTGKVRGLLCGPCNRGLGYLQDSLVILENSIKYLTTKDIKRD